MSEQPSSAARNRFLLTSLVVMLIFIMTLVVLLAAYPVVLAPPATTTPTITRTPTITPTRTQTPTITQIPTATRTRRPTFTSTFTLTPSLTPQPSGTPTPIGPPTLTPARPVLGENIYSLLPWSAEDADRVVALINDYPNTLLRQERGENDENYYAAFSYAILAQNEALLRFPDAPQADAWRWGLAYNLARTSSPLAGQKYANLIVAALNQGSIDPDEIAEWFGDKEPRLEFEITDIPPLSGYLSSRLVRIGGAGSAILLLLETPSAYQALTLTSDFNFIDPVEYNATAGELTGDGTWEAIVYPVRPVGVLELHPPRVFDLTELPPQELPFNPRTSSFPTGTGYFGRWEVLSHPSGTDRLKFDGILFPACPVHLSRVYTWNGELFEASEPEFRVEPSTNTLAFCKSVAEHAFRTWGARTAIQIMETVLPDWPPEVDEEGNAYPLDEIDEWRYRLGVYHALDGDFEGAIAILEEVVSEPTIASSRWIEPASEFLAAYQTPVDLYRACIISAVCDSRQALGLTVKSQSSQTPSALLTLLREAGVSLRATGYYDFDGDGSTESWFTVQHRPGEKLELWVLAAYPEGVEALYIETLEADVPDFIPYNEEDVPPILILEGRRAFQINREDGSLIPFVTSPELPQFWPNRYEEALEPIVADLFVGGDPAVLYERLLEIQESPGLLCVATWSCDRYYYLLGLSAELAGQAHSAVKNYLQVWWDNSKSPYTSMVRLRLKGPAVLPTFTPIPSGTPTSTPPATPTITGTPPTATVSPTMTVTPISYPYP